MSLLRVALLLSSFQVLSAAPTLFMPNNVTLPEDAPRSTLVARISATAAQYDRIVGAPFIVNSNPVVHPFIIIPKAPNNWELITTNEPKLNFEAVPLYTLQILVEDSKGTTATQSIVIEITHVNKAPVFVGTLAVQDAELYIAENTAVSTVIYKVAAKDPDNDVLQYSIRITPGNFGFQIDNSGTISTTSMFDYESNTKSYTLTVTISDGVLSRSANIKVYITNINDNVPTMTCVFSSITEDGNSTKTERSGNTSNIQLIEELPIGTIVNTCTGFDADLMNDLTFYLDPGNPYFTIHKETGTVIIISIMDSEAFGFSNIQSYTVKVCDQDKKCASIFVIATILPINDNPPFCDQYLYSFTNPEPIETDTVVATLNCHDRDIPPNALKYLPSNGPIGPDKLFQQTGNGNVIMVSKSLVYDTDPVTTYEMMVSVSDSADATHTVTATIIVSVTPVNNFDPEFNPTTYTFSVLETAKDGTILGQVTATDRDRPNCVRYSIRDGDTDIIHRFWINPTSGILELVTNPDFEIKPSYTMTIQATDCDPISPRKALAQVAAVQLQVQPVTLACGKSTKLNMVYFNTSHKGGLGVTVNIIEENDKAPVCKPSRYTAVIYDNVTAGININNFRLNCKDRDSDDTAMRFEIVSGNTNNHFAFDPTHGSHNPKLIVKSPFDFDNGADMQQRYNLIVHITDDNVKYGPAQHPRTGTAMIDISVIRTNTPPTTDYYKRKGVTIIDKEVNTYNPSAWYVPFLLTLMALLLAALFAWACHLLWKYTNLKALCQNAKNKVKKRVKFYKPGTKKEKVEKITETTIYEPVFHGEAIDPVTGNTYEFNNKSGARRWKTEQPKDSKVNLTDISAVTETLSSNISTAPAVNVT